MGLACGMYLRRLRSAQAVSFQRSGSRCFEGPFCRPADSRSRANDHVNGGAVLLLGWRRVTEPALDPLTGYLWTCRLDGEQRPLFQSQKYRSQKTPSRVDVGFRIHFDYTDHCRTARYVLYYRFTVHVIRSFVMVLRHT